jgi:hypothetical protein
LLPFQREVALPRVTGTASDSVLNASVAGEGALSAERVIRFSLSDWSVEVKMARQVVATI